MVSFFLDRCTLWLGKKLNILALGMTKSFLGRQELYTSALQYFEFYKIDTFLSLIALTISYVDLNNISASPEERDSYANMYLTPDWSLWKEQNFFVLVCSGCGGNPIK